MTDDKTDSIATDTTDEQNTTTEQDVNGEQEPTMTDSPGPIATRRGILTSAGILGLLGLGAGTASADASGQIGTSSDPLNKLYTAELNGGVTGDQSLTNIAGSGLTINSGSLETSGSSKWTDGSTSSLLKPSDSGDTGIEGISQMRTNDSLTVDIDADDSGTGSAFTVQTDKDSGSATSLLTVNEGGDVDVHNGHLDLNGNNLETSSGGLTVTTNDNGNLTLDPGSGNELQLSNQSTSSSGSLLAIDGSGNVKKASSTTLSDVGSGKWVDGSTSSLLKPSDGGDTGIEAVTQIRSNDSLTVDIDADNSGTGSSFTVQADTDSGAPTSLLTVNEGGDVDVHNGNLDLDGDLETTTVGGLTVTTNDNGNLTLDPGSNNELQLSNQSTSSSGNLLAIDGSGNVKQASSKTLSDVGGIGSSISVDSIDDDGSGSVTMNSDLDLNSNVLKSSSGTTDLIVQSNVLFKVDDASSTDDWFRLDNTGFYPGQDKGGDIGASSNRWQYIYASNGTVSTSDARLKDNVSNLTDGYEKVRSMRPVSYEWEEEDDSETRLGFIAQEIEEIVPEAVDRPDDEDAYLGMNYDMLIPVVVSALQEQQSITSDLEADIDAKDARIDDQQDRIERLESKIDNKDVALDALREALDDKDERIDSLEAESEALREENEQLRERNAALEDRLATVEAELGIDATASQQGVADD